MTGALLVYKSLSSKFGQVWRINFKTIHDCPTYFQPIPVLVTSLNTYLHLFRTIPTWMTGKKLNHINPTKPIWQMHCLFTSCRYQPKFWHVWSTSTPIKIVTFTPIQPQFWSHFFMLLLLVLTISTWKKKHQRNNRQIWQVHCLFKNHCCQPKHLMYYNFKTTYDLIKFTSNQPQFGHLCHNSPKNNWQKWQVPTKILMHLKTTKDSYVLIQKTLILVTSVTFFVLTIPTYIKSKTSPTLQNKQLTNIIGSCQKSIVFSVAIFFTWPLPFIQVNMVSFVFRSVGAINSGRRNVISETVSLIYWQKIWKRFVFLTI